MSNEIVSANDKADEGGVYVHELKTPFEFEGKNYTSFTLSFNKLTGKDMQLIERELDDIVYAPEFSSGYLFKLAARAAGVNAEIIENLPLRDAVVIKNKTRAFLLGRE